MKLKYEEGSTPLDPNELDGLIPNCSTTAELNELERANIASGYHWARTSRKLKKDILEVSGVLLLHRKLFGDVWHWAGAVRNTERNLGVSPAQIQPQLQNLLDNVRYWIEHKVFPWHEIAIRFHHELVKIHPFPNGNGRLARIAADLLLIYNGEAPCSWGSGNLVFRGELRSSYITALKNADKNLYDDLIALCK
jgi:Fic-DOC domain mobile mystery protein B